MKKEKLEDLLESVDQNIEKIKDEMHQIDIAIANGTVTFEEKKEALSQLQVLKKELENFKVSMIKIDQAYCKA